MISIFDAIMTMGVGVLCVLTYLERQEYKEIVNRLDEHENDFDAIDESFRAVGQAIQELQNK